MGTHKHLLSQVDLVNKRAVCLSCGLVGIYQYPTGRIKCKGAIRQHNQHYRKGTASKQTQKRYKLTRGGRILKEELQSFVMSNACEVCGSHKQLCIDHDHTTHKIRGTLCAACNKALGFVRDEIGTLLGLAAYLERAQSK